MSKFSAKQHDKDTWEIWEHLDGSKRQICIMSADDILEIFNETVPRVVEEPFLYGDENCKHTWTPWKFNNNFIRCTKCPAMKKVIKLVPREYKHGS